MAAWNAISSLRTAWRWITATPARAAVAAIVVVGGVSVGGGLALVMNAARDAAASPSLTPVPTEAMAAATPSPTSKVTPSPATPSASAPPTPSSTPEPPATSGPPSVTERPQPTTAPASTPHPTPVPTATMLTGTWERLPAAPNPDGLWAGSAVRLLDGQVAVAHWNWAISGWGDCIAVFTPAAAAWEIPAATGAEDDSGCMFPSSSGWVAHPDGKLYGLYLVTDPSVDPWTVESTPWRHESLLPSSIGTTTDGRLYGPVNHNGVGRLYELDPLAGTTEFVSEYDPIELDDVVAGVAARLYIGTNDVDTHTSPLVSYDPATGDWRDEGSGPFAALWEHAAHGPEGWIYVPDSSERLWARSPEGEWVLVELPDDLPDRWRPAFVDGGDGRLYAMDAQQPYVFTPGEVAEIPLR